MSWNSNEYHDLVARKQVENLAALEKERALTAERMYLAQCKVWLKEQQKESDRARYDNVFIDSEGNLKLEVINPLLQVPQRMVANFRVRDIVQLVSLEGDEYLYSILLQIAGAEKTLFISARKAGNAQYLIRKFCAVGGKILSSKRTEQIAIVESLWATLVAGCKKKKIIPTNYGWIKIADDEYMFWDEGEFLWNDLMKMTK